MQQQTAPDSDNAKSNSDQSHSATADSIGLRSSDSSSSFAHMSQPMNPSHRPPRPMTEIFSRQSAETEALDKWFDELQLYEKNLEDMASASFDPNFKEELHHVDQWYRALTEAERTAAIYSLLQHSSQVQLRFFSTVLQQMHAKDPVSAMLSPAHPEKGDLQAQMVGAMAKAEKEASQKLLSVLPYQTGQVTRRPPESLQGRRSLDRHSFAIGDTEEYNRLFTNPLGNDFLSPHTSNFGNTSASLLDDQSLLSRAHLKSNANDKPGHTGSPLFGARPRSVVESGDISSSMLGNDWAYGNRSRTTNNVGHIGDRSMNGRPKSADVANWYNSDIPPPIGDKGLSDRGRQFPSNSPWNLTPSVSSFTERDAGIDRGNTVSDVDLQNALASWSLANNLGYPRANVMMNDDSKGFRRRPMTRGAGIPRTVPESDEQNNNAFYSTFGENEREKGSQPPLGSGNSTLTGSGSQSRSVSRSGSPAPSASNSTGHFGNSSFGMWSGKHLSVPGLDKQAQQQQQQQHSYGQFLNPNDANFDGGDLDYVSDHSDTSVISANGTRRRRTSATGNSRAIKDKKAAEVVDMELLQDVSAWFRSLRLHKYNSVFESMKWQDIVKLSDEDLVSKGVAALGARRKMLKVFENVRIHCDANNIPY